MSEKKEIKKIMPKHDPKHDIEKRNTPNRVLPTSPKPRPVLSPKSNSDNKPSPDNK